jgi:ADP-ribosylglycohydrolase
MSGQIGSLVAAAYGDSLGAAVEFLSLSEIRRKYGKRGISRCDTFFELPPGSITDDTQMAIFTGQGLINAFDRKVCVPRQEIIVLEVWHAYLRWLKTQDDSFERRAPGNTCLSALQSGMMGTKECPLNNSAGCGAIMRAHPVGILLKNDLDAAFEIGIKTGAITHGHPNGYVPAGALASIIAACLNGRNLEQSINLVLEQLKRLPAWERCGTVEVIETAMNHSTEGDFGLIIDQDIRCSGSSGGGWQGHDALGIALFSLRCAPDDPLKAVEISVNHSGDSDSTGSVTGAIAGAIHGEVAFLNHLVATGVKLEHYLLLKEIGERLKVLGDLEGIYHEDAG